MMWLASSTMGKGIPSSDWKESMGDKVPLVRMTERQHSKSANPWNNVLYYKHLLVVFCVCSCVCVVCVFTFIKACVNEMVITVSETVYVNVTF